MISYMKTIFLPMNDVEAMNFRDQWIKLGSAHKYDISDYENHPDPSFETYTLDLYNGDRLEFRIFVARHRPYSSLTKEEAETALVFADSKIKDAKRHRDNLRKQIKTLKEN